VARLVPPTLVTHGSLAGYWTAAGPVGVNGGQSPWPPEDEAETDALNRPLPERLLERRDEASRHLRFGANTSGTA
jgi:hypothetical protein